MKLKGKFLGYTLLCLMVICVLMLGGCAMEGETETEGESGFPMMIVLLVVMFVVFYFLMIRPQRKKQSEQKTVVQELKRGDKVITIGGIYGEVDSVGERYVILKVEGGTRLKLLKTSIMGKQEME